MQVQGLQRRGESGVAILVDNGRHPEPVRVILELESAPSQRITRIEVAVGD
jgi:hypothetical protein